MAGVDANLHWLLQRCAYHDLRTTLYRKTGQGWVKQMCTSEREPLLFCPSKVSWQWPMVWFVCFAAQISLCNISKAPNLVERLPYQMLHHFTVHQFTSDSTLRARHHYQLFHHFTDVSCHSQMTRLFSRFTNSRAIRLWGRDIIISCFTISRVWAVILKWLVFSWVQVVIFRWFTTSWVLSFMLIWNIFILPKVMMVCVWGILACGTLP